MKKIYQLIILLAVLFSTTSLSATTHTITVQNYFFAPTTLNVAVGDTIVWSWISGSHLVASLTNIPAGAPSFSGPVNSTTTEYSYVVTVAGNYDYHCDFHSSMTGSFSATTTGISSPQTETGFNVYAVQQNVFAVSFSLNASIPVQLSVFDLTGKAVKILSESFQPAGIHKEIYSLEDLRKGIYLVEIIAGNSRLSRRIVIE